MPKKYTAGEHPVSLANLKPAKPGEVRNPKGLNQHTYRLAFETQIQKILEEEVPGTGKTKRELLARVFYDRAAKGEAWAARLMADRIWPAKQEVELSGSLAVEQEPDLTKLSQEELDTLEALHDKVLQ